MTKKQNLETMMEQTEQPSSSPAFDTFTAAWAVSKDKIKTRPAPRAGP